MNREKVHEYLGLSLGFIQQRKVKVTMTDYVYKMLRKAQDAFYRTASTLASRNFFTIYDDSLKL